MSDVLNYNPDCLFCKIIKGDIPSNKVYEDDLCYAFYDIDPQAPTHFLVIPKAHIQSCGAVTAENAALVGHMFQVIAQVTKELGITDFRVVSNCGAQAGQTVPHLHFHVLAGRDMTWPPGLLTLRKRLTPFPQKEFRFALRLGAASSGPCDARSARSVFPTPQRKQTCRRHVCSVGRSGYAARREPCGCSLTSAASGRRNSARPF